MVYMENLKGYRSARSVPLGATVRRRRWLRKARAITSTRASLLDELVDEELPQSSTHESLVREDDVMYDTSLARSSLRSSGHGLLKLSR
jgi:hypothetical protein